MQLSWILPVFAATILVYLSIAMFAPKSSGVFIVLGSGGHTAEMMRFLPDLNQKITFIVADNDKSSQSKLPKNALVERIPRARNVHQSWLTTLFSTAWAFIVAAALVLKSNPRLIICNGPGTCVPVCLVAAALRFLRISSCRILFIESIARVSDLSLSGRILYPFADRFVVQWKELVEMFPKAEFYGRLV